MSQEQNLASLTDSPEIVHQLLAFCGSRLSHALRTPLGIAMAVTDDMARGIELSGEDIEDARCALRTIVDLADLLRTFGQSRSQVDDQLCLREEVEALVSQSWAKSGGFKIEIVSSGQAKNTGRVLFIKALECALRFAASKWKRIVDSKNKIPYVRVEACGDSERIEISLPDDDKSSKTEKTFLALAEQDHSSESIGLVFTAVAMSLLGGEARYVSKESKQFLELCF